MPPRYWKSNRGCETSLQWFEELEFILQHHGTLFEHLCHVDGIGFQLSLANNDLAATEEGTGMGWN